MALRGGLPTESGAVGVEGPRLVEEALRSASPVRAVLFSESGERHHARLAQYLDRREVSISHSSYHRFASLKASRTRNSRGRCSPGHPAQFFV